MARKKKSLAEEAGKTKVQMQMTPMIDMTFLILTFFMLVCHLSTLNLEAIQLPHADEARKRQIEKMGKLKGTVIVNVKKEDTEKLAEGKRQVRIAGRIYDPDKLKAYIQRRAQEAVVKYGPETNVGSLPKGVVVSPLKVIIRCDRYARYEAVTWIMEACSMSRPGVIHVYMAATQQRYPDDDYPRNLR
ncbi:MAG: hypothetical protein DRP82_03880 [Planctomycetota bacterium]|nr:MAG: hypothetical protein DRP82_03880 [Planctomycetota bacterium]